MPTDGHQTPADEMDAADIDQPVPDDDRPTPDRAAMKSVHIPRTNGGAR